MGFDMSKLGVKKNIPKVNFTDYNGILVCPPKFGKTTMASLFPKAIIVPFENGFNAQVVDVVENLNTWDDFVMFVDKLEKNRADIGDELQTIVFDTANEAYKLCLPYMLKKESIKAGTKYTAIGDLPYGAGYAKVDEYFKVQVDRLMKLGFTILFISHSSVKTIKPKTGEPYDTYTSTMPDRLEKLIYPLVDYIVFGEKRTIIEPSTGETSVKRAMLVSGGSSDENGAGSRVALSTDIVFDNEAEAVEKFQKHFSEAIAEKLRKAGITKDINTISKEQAEEKAKNVAQYVESQSEPTKEELLADIKKGYVTATEEAKVAMAKYMGENSVTSLQNAEVISLEVLKGIKAILV